MRHRNTRLEVIGSVEKTVRGLARKMGTRESNIEKLFSLDADEYLESIARRPDLRTSVGRLQDFLSLRKDLMDSQTIVFSTEQAEVFQGMGATYAESIDYLLPFSRIYLQLTKPLPIRFENADLQLFALILKQIMSPGGVVDDSNKDYIILTPGQSEGDITYVNSVCGMVIHETGGMGSYQISWMHTTTDAWLSRGCTGSDLLKAMAVGCIGYINCENIYLHKEGQIPDKVNRKREREGKKVLEPYYVCRIRGVQYDSNGEPTGEGTHHGFRYDVRGHFRKLATGKTTWVRPHQRGLQNELYIPKTYVVEKGAKQTVC